jgi:hypothetical protein
MSSPTEPQTAATPSLSRLAKTTVAAIVVASILLVTFVLPAEYAVDPLGTGRMLGLTDIARPPAPAAAVPAPEGAPLAPTLMGPLGLYPREFKFDVFDFELQPYEYVEYKYQMEKGATMLFSWTSSAAVSHDFHGERAAGATDGPPEESFDKEARNRVTAAYTAPFAGIHGWYWENPGGEPIKVRLNSAGFYSSAVEIHSNRTRHPHALRPLDALPAAPAAPGN